MDKIYVVLLVAIGNTQAMAEAGEKGIIDGGKEAVILRVEDAPMEELKKANVALRLDVRRWEQRCWSKRKWSRLSPRWKALHQEKHWDFSAPIVGAAVNGWMTG